MSLSWSEIKETILQNYEVGYSRKSILNSVNTIVKTWGRDYVEKYPKNTVWNIAHLIDQGLIINELKGLAGSELLFDRLRKKERAAFSEARLACFFSKKGHDVILEPTSARGQFNDLAVKFGDTWIYIEVKTPNESEIKKGLNKQMSSLLGIANQVKAPRNVHICLGAIPTFKDTQEIKSVTVKLANDELQPQQVVLGKIAWIRTELSEKRFEINGNIWKTPIDTASYSPKIFDSVYGNFPTLFYTHLGWDTNRIVEVKLTIPYEDNRLIDFIRDKRKQLSPDNPNILAIDTSYITMSYPNISRRLIQLSDKSRHDDFSSRVGAILLFKNLVMDGKIYLDSVLLEQDKPYVTIPEGFLEQCNLRKYIHLIETNKRTRTVDLN